MSTALVVAGGASSALAPIRGAGPTGRGRKRQAKWTAEDLRARERGDAKRTRWASSHDRAGGSGPRGPLAFCVPTGLTAEQERTYVLRIKLDETTRRLDGAAAEAAAAERNPDRSPSPRPQYDSAGRRTNTREQRLKERYGGERKRIIRELMDLNPAFRPPPEMVDREKLRRRLYIPHREFPDYNFVGLIIGPRGNTQKRLERETRCKIAVRGRGSLKEGRARPSGIFSEGDDDDLHVSIHGERIEDVEKAVAIVKELLVPIDDDRNEHKQQQLQELAVINGTLREVTFCHTCGEPGHNAFACPNRGRSFAAAGVRCSVCGESSHVTSDCPKRGAAGGAGGQADEEYRMFMSEMGEGGGGAAGGRAAAGGRGGGGHAAAPWHSGDTAIAVGGGPPGGMRGPPPAGPPGGAPAAAAPWASGADAIHAGPGGGPPPPAGFRGGPPPPHGGGFFPPPHGFPPPGHGPPPGFPGGPPPHGFAGGPPPPGFPPPFHARPPPGGGPRS